MLPLYPTLFLSAFLFCVGIVLVISKKHIIVVLIGLELMFNAANLNFITFSQFDHIRLQGQVFALMVMSVAAAEAAVGLAIIIQVYRFFQTIHLDKLNQLKG